MGLNRLIGRALRGMRAGRSHLAWNAPEAISPICIELRSPAFAPGAPIPLRHAGVGVGDNLSPPLTWGTLPLDTAELALIIEDPDAPLPRPVIHAVVTGIAPQSGALPEGALNVNSSVAPSGPHFHLGRGSFGRLGYAGPRALPGHGRHTYVFQIFALDRHLELSDHPTRDQLVHALRGAVLGRGRLEGTFERD
jgi:Raf kinase inhibitor-like YbhB/YbcL family protein